MFIFLDTETTGSGPADHLCQIAFKAKEGVTVNKLFNPGMPITIDAMIGKRLTAHTLSSSSIIMKLG
jgi:hypothetical protein